MAVIGPSAADARNLFGDYAYPAHVESLRVLLDSGGDPFARETRDAAAAPAFDVRAPTVLDALRARLGSRVRYARGCDVEGGTRDGFAEAAALAQEADVAVLVVGDKSGLTDDCTSGETRDRAASGSDSFSINMRRLRRPSASSHAPYPR